MSTVEVGRCYHGGITALIQLRFSFIFASPSSILVNAAGAVLGVGRRSLCNFCVVDTGYSNYCRR